MIREFKERVKAVVTEKAQDGNTTVGRKR